MAVSVSAAKLKKTDRGAKRNPAHKKVLIVFLIIFIVYSSILAFPFLWMIFNSFKDKTEFFHSQWTLPTQFRIENYIEIFRVFDLGEMILNSVILCVACPTVSIISTSFAAYALAKFRFRLNRFFFGMSLVPMVVQIAGGMSALYLLMLNIGLFDTHLGIILMSAGGMGMNFLLVYGVFKNVSDTYMEAATIDGAGYWRTFLTIMLPQASGILGTLWVLGFIGQWNDYGTVAIFLPSHQTISTGIKYIGDNITAGEYVLDYPKYFAAIIITALPVVLLFLFFQDSIMRISLGGGLKG